MAELDISVPVTKPRYPCPNCDKESKPHGNWSEATRTGQRICMTKNCPDGEGTDGPDGRTIFTYP